MAILGSGTFDVAATNNYWGDDSGPLDNSDDRATGGLFNPTGLGQAVSDNVSQSRGRCTK